jgi:translation initiation factor IF-3
VNHGGGNRGIVKRLRINLQIRAGKVRLIGEEGEQLGVVPSSQALQIAREHELDLVEVAPTASPPVCKIIDYGKYKYEQAKKERKAKKGQKVGLLREVRLRPKIEDHDLQGKIKITRKLLGEGNKVKVRVRFRGRERVYPEMGMKVLQKLTESLKDVAMVSNWSTGEVGNMFAVLAPVSREKSKEVKSNAQNQDT